MINTYKEIFNLNLSHSYYASGICNVLSYKESEETNQIANRFSIKLQLKASGFSLYTATTQSIEDFLNYITQSTSGSYFEYLVEATNQSFYNFTDIPINTIGYFNYDSGNVTESENEIILQSSFIETSAASEALRIRIHFSDIITSYKTGNPIQYAIKLTARATQWQYNIINSSGQEFNQLKITSDNHINFEDPEQVTLANGQKALQFSTGSQRISLTDTAKFKVNLVNLKEGALANNSQIVFKGLPIPNPDTFTIIEKDDNVYVASLMYIYV